MFGFNFPESSQFGEGSTRLKIRKCNSFIQKGKETDGMKLQASLASVRGKLFEANNGDVKVGHLEKKVILLKHSLMKVILFSYFISIL